MAAVFWCFAIVLFHTSSHVEETWYKELMSDCRMGGVGFFFVVSGYFIMRRFNRASIWLNWRIELRKRLRSLRIPYLLWSLAGCFVVLSKAGVASLNINVALQLFGINSIAPSANGPLWYIKFLFLFTLTYPLLGVVLGKRWTGNHIISFVLLSLIPLLPVPMKFSLFYSYALFCMGASLSLSKLDIGGDWKGVVIGVVGYALIYHVRLYNPGCIALRMYSAYFAIIAIGSVCMLLSNASAEEFSRKLPTFFVYCVHGLILKVIPISASTPIRAVACAFGVFCLSMFVAVLM